MSGSAGSVPRIARCHDTFCGTYLAGAVTRDFSRGRPPHSVIAIYDPTRYRLMRYHVPTPDWTEHMVATCAVAPGFSARLSAALRASPQP
ncbi:MAG: hypothetical protein HXY39_06900 [Chloroflexi bacterium]|nr:hypothetical protein [Chloroflexota bacterium]